uniref:Uncharacterized protein n=1 Tax=Oryza barthii TaxID=65489 RepID=A0A0D3HH61_9ORYZ
MHRGDWQQLEVPILVDQGEFGEEGEVSYVADHPITQTRPTLLCVSSTRVTSATTRRPFSCASASSSGTRCLRSPMLMMRPEVALAIAAATPRSERSMVLGSTWMIRYGEAAAKSSAAEAAPTPTSMGLRPRERISAMRRQFSSPAPARFPAGEGTSASSAAAKLQRKRGGGRVRVGRRPRSGMGGAGRRMASLMSPLRNPASAKTRLTTGSSRMARTRWESSTLTAAGVWAVAAW